MKKVKIERKGKLIYFHEVEIGQFFKQRESDDLYFRVNGSYFDDKYTVVCWNDNSITKFHSQQQVILENFKLVEE